MNTQFTTPPPFKKPNPTVAPAAPTATLTPMPPQATAVAPPAQEVPVAAAPAVKKPKQAKNNVMISGDHIKFVLQNISKMNYTEIADKLSITKNQVNRILQTLKGGIDQHGNPFGLRGKALVAAKDAGEQAYALKEDGKPDFSQPVSELAQKVEAKIEAELSRPADSRPGAGRKGGGAVKQALDAQLDELLSGL